MGWTERECTNEKALFATLHCDVYWGHARRPAAMEKSTVSATRSCDDSSSSSNCRSNNNDIASQLEISYIDRRRCYLDKTLWKFSYWKQIPSPIAREKKRFTWLGSCHKSAELVVVMEIENDTCRLCWLHFVGGTAKNWLSTWRFKTEANDPINWRTEYPSPNRANRCHQSGINLHENDVRIMSSGACAIEPFIPNNKITISNGINL